MTIPSYLLRCPLAARGFLAAVRRNWGIENCVHWILDISFREVQSRVRTGYAPGNFAVLRHIVLSLLQQQQTKGISLKGKRKKAGWDTEYLLQVLHGI